MNRPTALDYLPHHVRVKLDLAQHFDASVHSATARSCSLQTLQFVARSLVVEVEWTLGLQQQALSHVLFERSFHQRYES